MFTGIIKEQAEVILKKQNRDGMTLLITKQTWSLKPGDSISINGVCSTVRSIEDGGLFEYMPESLLRSNLSDLQIGDSVNMERSLLVSDRLDGHIVQGHIDTTGVIRSVIGEGNSVIFKISVKHHERFMKFLAPKGAVAVDGISLTVVDVEEDWFTVKIIPYTLEHTNLGKKESGSWVNIEFDVMAKYLERLLPNMQNYATHK